MRLMDNLITTIKLIISFAIKVREEEGAVILFLSSLFILIIRNFQGILQFNHIIIIIILILRILFSYLGYIQVCMNMNNNVFYNVNSLYSTTNITYVYVQCIVSTIYYFRTEMYVHPTNSTHCMYTAYIYIYRDILQI